MHQGLCIVTLNGSTRTLGTQQRAQHSERVRVCARARARRLRRRSLWRVLKAQAVRTLFPETTFQCRKFKPAVDFENSLHLFLSQWCSIPPREPVWHFEPFRLAARPRNHSEPFWVEVHTWNSCSVLTQRSTAQHSTIINTEFAGCQLHVRPQKTNYPTLALMKKLTRALLREILINVIEMIHLKKLIPMFKN